MMKKKRREKRKKREKQFSNVKVSGSGCAAGVESSSFPLFVVVKKKKEDNS
jgi:hypothetical protein